MRPARLVVVTGTGTDVGKTWVGAAVLAEARSRGLVVAARKPAQSYEPGAGPTDSSVLAAATGEHDTVVCPEDRNYPVPMAPPMAAARLDRPVPTVAEMTDLGWPAGPVDLALVEGAGGVASPLAADGDTAALARALDPDAIVLVADPALGVINAVRLSLAALEPLPVVVHLNRFDPGAELHRLNLQWLRDTDGLPVTTAVGELVDLLLGS